jgi:hypothetical protein
LFICIWKSIKDGGIEDGLYDDHSEFSDEDFETNEEFEDYS